MTLNPGSKGMDPFSYPLRISLITRPSWVSKMTIGKYLLSKDLGRSSRGYWQGTFCTRCSSVCRKGSNRMISKSVRTTSECPSSE